MLRQLVVLDGELPKLFAGIRIYGAFRKPPHFGGLLAEVSGIRHAILPRGFRQEG